MKTRRLVALTIFALLWGSLAFPATAHNRCDHADHTHRIYQAWPPRTYLQHWRYLRVEFSIPWMDVWSVDGSEVKLPSRVCR